MTTKSRRHSHQHGKFTTEHLIKCNSQRKPEALITIHPDLSDASQYPPTIEKENLSVNEESNGSGHYMRFYQVLGIMIFPLESAIVVGGDRECWELHSSEQHGEEYYNENNIGESLTLFCTVNSYMQLDIGAGRTSHGLGGSFDQCDLQISTF